MTATKTPERWLGTAFNHKGFLICKPCENKWLEYIPKTNLHQIYDNLLDKNQGDHKKTNDEYHAIWTETFSDWIGSSTEKVLLT
jgi:hypothetical protein